VESADVADDGPLEHRPQGVRVRAGGRSRKRREPTVAERRIARQLARAEPDSARLILAEYGSTLRGYLSQLFGNDRQLAEDVLQQVLLQAWQSGASYDATRGPLLSWLMMIARSRALDALRRRVPEPRDPASAVRSLDDVSHQEDHADRIAAHWQLHHLLASLTPETTALLRMRFQLGLSQSEIAAQTGIPLGTVKRRMANGLERLREQVETIR
jgi:RNA polymerase sigma-70 factor, ECF subfamily